MKELSSFQKEFCSAAGELAMKLSFARSVGQVFGLLYIHSDPLALDDISVLLKMSKGSVSINLRVLEGWGAIRKVLVSGDRRARFTAEHDLVSLAFTRVEQGVKSRVAWARGRMGEMESLLDRSGGKNPELSARMGGLLGLLEKVEGAVAALPKLRTLMKLAAPWGKK